jgi:RNA polymerase sigma-70 factor (ECF subfamily)
VSPADPARPSTDAARRAAELAARASYGRLVAMAAARTRDIAGAEDALADAFAAALVRWPEVGVPDRPEAWLLTVARRGLMRRARHRRVVDASTTALVSALEARADDAADGALDPRLRLMFVCAHPAIDPAIRTPLMLQTVLGLEAEHIASAFLVSPTTMGQRLVRAKTKIRDARLRFELPEPEALPERLDDVLRAIYAAYGVGWDDLDRGRGLTDEALYLGRLLVAMLPDAPEARGLLALMSHCESRRDARRDADGRFIPLARQDTSRWDTALVIEAEEQLTQAARARTFGRFQCEAAIQSVHAQRAITGVLQHDAILTLYGMLLAYAPTVGVAVARAAALLAAGRADEARRALDALAPEDVRTYAPYWVTRAHLAAHAGDAEAHRHALTIALGLTEAPSVRRFLEAELGR